MNKAPKVYVVTLNYNGLDWLKDCLDSISNLNYTNFNVLLVDNGSADNSIKFVKENYDDIEILENKSNLGYSEGFNRGINYAIKNDAEYILIMNNDTVIDKDALTQLVKTATTDSKIGFVSGKVYYHSKPNTFQTVGRLSDPHTIVGPHVGSYEEDIGQYDKIKDYDFIDDVFMLVSTDTIKETGAYDKDFFLQYEETDWCIRVRKAGYRIVYVPEAKIWHKGTLTSGGTYSPINTFYNARNRTIFMKKNSTQSQWFSYIIKLFFNVVPKRVINLVIKGQTHLIFSYISGIISSLIWIINFKPKNEGN